MDKKITSIINKINQITKKQDRNLTDGIKSLIEGYNKDNVKEPYFLRTKDFITFVNGIKSDEVDRHIHHVAPHSLDDIVMGNFKVLLQEYKTEE